MRSKERGEAAKARIEADAKVKEGKGTVEVMMLDVSDLDSVRAFAAALKTKYIT